MGLEARAWKRTPSRSSCAGQRARRWQAASTVVTTPAQSSCRRAARRASGAYLGTRAGGRPRARRRHEAPAVRSRLRAGKPHSSHTAEGEAPMRLYYPAGSPVRLAQRDCSQGAPLLALPARSIWTNTERCCECSTSLLKLPDSRAQTASATAFTLPCASERVVSPALAGSRDVSRHRRACTEPWCAGSAKRRLRTRASAPASPGSRPCTNALKSLSAAATYSCWPHKVGHTAAGKRTVDNKMALAAACLQVLWPAPQVCLLPCERQLYRAQQQRQACNIRARRVQLLANLLLDQRTAALAAVGCHVAAWLCVKWCARTTSTSFGDLGTHRACLAGHCVTPLRPER